MELETWVQIPDKAVYISLGANALEKGMSLPVLFPSQTMDK